MSNVKSGQTNTLAYYRASLQTGQEVKSRFSAATLLTASTQIYSRSHDAVILIFDNAGDVIQMHKDAGAFTEW